MAACFLNDIPRICVSGHLMGVCEEQVFPDGVIVQTTLIAPNGATMTDSAGNCSAVTVLTEQIVNADTDGCWHSCPLVPNVGSTSGTFLDPGNTRYQIKVLDGTTNRILWISPEFIIDADLLATYPRDASGCVQLCVLAPPPSVPPSNPFCEAVRQCETRWIGTAGTSGLLSVTAGDNPAGLAGNGHAPVIDIDLTALCTHVRENCETEFAAIDAFGIVWTPGGINGHTPTATFTPSADAGQAIAVGADGQPLVRNASLAADAAAQTLTFTDNLGAATVVGVPLPALQVADTPSIDMTIVGSGTTADPWIISGVTTDQIAIMGTPTNCIATAVAGDGTAAAPYNVSAIPIISPDPSNALACTASGLFAPATDLRVADGPCIDMTLAGAGTFADPWIVSAAPIIDTTTGVTPGVPDNQLVCGPAGLYVPPAADGAATALVDGGDATLIFTEGALQPLVIPLCDLIDDIAPGVFSAANGDLLLAYNATDGCRLVATPRGRSWMVGSCDAIDVTVPQAAGANPSVNLCSGAGQVDELSISGLGTGLNGTVNVQALINGVAAGPVVTLNPATAGPSGQIMSALIPIGQALVGGENLSFIVVAGGTATAGTLGSVSVDAHGFCTI